MTLAWLCVFSVVAALPAQTYRGKIGGEVESPTEGSRGRGFVDLGRGFRPWAPVSGSGAVPLDADGWPMSDAQTVLFDIRPVPAWAPPIDDPAMFQPDWSGTYRLSFSGQALLSGFDPSQITVANQAYDASSNTTTADLVLAPGVGVATISFANTKRTAASTVNSGIANLRVIRPGYPADTTQPFTREYLKSAAPFGLLRFMGFAATNDSNPPFTDADNRTHWTDRHLPTDATQQDIGRRHGVAWEYAILLANLTGKDMWINIPVAADDDYVAALATLLRETLRSDLNVYIEHSNEVWNPLFSQYAYNVAAAQAEVGAGGSKLNADGSTDPNVWAQRRHAERLVQIANIFQNVFGAGAVNRRIRVIYAWWTIFPGQYSAVLKWVNDKYGEPSQFFYGLAETHYFNAQSAAPNADVPAVLAAMRTASDAGVAYTKSFRVIADTYGLKLLTYEGGPDNGGGSTVNIGNRILANRDPGMKDLIVHDVQDNYFAQGGDMYNYFTISGAYSRYGCWGATDDAANLATVKFQAINQLVGALPAPTISQIADAAGYGSVISGGSFVVIFGSNFTDRPVTWTVAIPNWTTALPMTLNGVFVRMNGQDAFIYYAGPGQINALAPPGLPAGPVTIEVTTEGGTVTAFTTAAEAAPAFFTNAVGGKRIVAALFAGTAVYVAGEGTFAGIVSRAARAGDYLELFANGLGPTARPYPAGQVLAAPYRLAAANQLRVTIGGVNAPVQDVNLTYAGLYQINILVPPGIPAGDQPVVLTIGDRSTLGGNFLTFAVDN